MIIKANFQNFPQVGVFCVTNDQVTLVAKGAPKSFITKIKETLKTDIIETNIANSQLIGLYTACNNKEIIIPDITTQDEIDKIRSHFDKITISESKHNAIGNLVAMNDHITLSSSSLRNNKQLNSTTFKLSCSSLIGSSIFVTNKGFLAHPEATETDIQKLKKLLKVKGDVGTVNFGNPYVRSGLIANENGIIAGNLCSGPELNRMDDIFNL